MSNLCAIYLMLLDHVTKIITYGCHLVVRAAIADALQLETSIAKKKGERSKTELDGMDFKHLQVGKFGQI